MVAQESSLASTKSSLCIHYPALVIISSRYSRHVTFPSEYYVQPYTGSSALSNHANGVNHVLFLYQNTTVLMLLPEKRPSIFT
jgi:hypothetical protein